MSLFQTIPGTDYTTVDDRVWSHPGPVVDLGCDPWDWSAVFLGKKPVIGADPFAQPIEGAELYQGAVCATTGETTISCAKDASTIIFPTGSVCRTRTLSWKDFKTQFGIADIALLKINIEGAEYSLLNSLEDSEFKRIDQIAITFHHFIFPVYADQTAAALERLRQAGYTIMQTSQPWHWYLCRYAQ